MLSFIKIVRAIVVAGIVISCSKKPPEVVKDTRPSDSVVAYKEQYRPQIHFSPPSHWMNDPNGMVYYDGEHHLFYQHYPKDVVWGPMHWGHAVTTDLVHWTNLPIALEPDSLGMIFSGSAVMDLNNTSGFGTATTPPMVAMFTYHNPEREKAKRIDVETQGIAYSVDKGRTWTKYDRNPVIGNPGARDFRDPKMMWHEQTKQWIVTVVAGDHAQFYASKDLKQWTRVGEFGKEYGSHGGVWECPDLFPMKVAGEKKEKWVLVININPGGPNAGSATQYFVGDFDGKKFTTDAAKSKVSWIDYGPDNYASVTWSNEPKGRTLMIGWMSNWEYAPQVPTSTWRSACTVVRELKLKRVNGELVVQSAIAPEFLAAVQPGESISQEVKDSVRISNDLPTGVIHGMLDTHAWKIVLSNDVQQRVVVGYDADQNRFFVDRSASGDTTFSSKFKPISYAPRISKDKHIPISMVVDVSSVEVFLDDGTTVLTSIFFPQKPLNKVMLMAGAQPVRVDSLTAGVVKPVW